MFRPFMHLLNIQYLKKEAGQLSRYSDEAKHWKAEESGFDSRKRHENFIYSITSRPDLQPTQPPIHLVLRLVSPGLKRQRRETDHLPPSSAVVKNGGARTQLPAWYLIN
jgi:hypothetical protein